MTLEVYWGGNSPYVWRVLLALEIKQIPYWSKRLSFSEEDLKTDEFLKINPRGQVPAIRDGGFTLYESIAILCYLEDSHPNPPLFGKSAAERGLIWRIIMECVCYLEPHLVPFAGALFSEESADKREQAVQSRRQIEKELTRLNQSLSKTNFLAGNLLSAADIAVYPVVRLLVKAANRDKTGEIGGTLRNCEEHYPALPAWFKRIEAIPGYDRTHPPNW
ncbi:MAG: glutathione S-transferase family protein [Gammaproteobacteria bacterium]